MSIALSEFWTRLVRSGIVDAADCKDVAKSFAKANSGTPPSDSESVARFMVKRGVMTRFQARAVMSSPPRELRAGSFLIRTDETVPPMGRWVEAKSTSDGRLGFLLHVGLQSARQGFLEALAAHQSVKDEALQPLESEFHSSSMLVFSSLPPGDLLLERLSVNKTLEAREVCRMGAILARALAAIHANSLFHGEVRLDRVWSADNGDFLLLRDPVFSSESSQGQDAWLERIESPTLYAAPERSETQTGGSPSSDIYSLGCLLFRAATGRYPFKGADDAATIAAHRSEAPQELSDAVSRGEDGDPLFRVLAFAMAKNPASRFADASQFSVALNATEKLLSSTPSKATVGSSDKQAAKSKDKRKLDARTGTSPSAGASAKKRVATSKRKTAKTDVSDSARPRPSRSATESTGQTANKSSALKTEIPGDAQRQAAARESRPAATPSRRQSGGRSTDQKSAGDRGTGRTDANEKPATATSSLAGEQRLVPDAFDVPSDSGAKRRSALSEGPDERIESVTGPKAGLVAEPPSMEVSAPDGALEGVNSSSKMDDRDPPSGPTSGRPKSSSRRRRKKSSKAPLVLGGLGVVVLLLIVGLIAADPDEPEDRPQTRREVPKVIPSVTSNPTSPAVPPKPVEPASNGFELVDDQRLLFAPPYSADAQPPSLAMIPPGPAVIASVRLADLRGRDSGAQLIDGLSPELDELILAASTRSKLEADAINRLTVALYPGKGGWPDVSLVVELTEPKSEEDLITLLDVAAARTPGGQTIYAGDEPDGDAYYWGQSENSQVTTFAIGTVSQISEVAAAEGGAIPLPRSSQKLWSGSSADSELVILITPNFLFADGRELLIQTVPELISGLRRLMQPDVAAAVVTANFGDADRVFIETRLAPSGGISEAALMRKVSDAVQTWPAWAEQFILDSVPDPSWRLLAIRLPSMMRFLVDQMRFGVSDGVVVANCYLPANALPQLTLATVLAMNTPTGGALAAPEQSAPTTLTIEQMLDREMSVSFDQESLEFALDAIVNAFKDGLPRGVVMPPARIIGGDLQLMGITQNQQVRDFQKSNEPLRAVLTDLVVRANPDKSATGSSDPKQALVWVVVNDGAAPNQAEILITTRQAAEGKYELPDEFVLEANAP